MLRLPLHLTCAVVSLFSAACAMSARAQSAGPSISPRPDPRQISTPEPLLHADSSLVLIPAHVTRPNGVPVTGLQKENFRIIENDVEQRITHFTQDDAPVSVGLLLDVSGSMRPKMTKAVEAAVAFFRTSNTQDEFSLIEFSDGAKLCIPFTRDVDEVAARIGHTHPFGQTALLDAVHLGLRSMKSAHNDRKALVILSDGGDNHSRHSATEIKNELYESDVQVFAMGVFDAVIGEQSPEEERNGPQLLDQLAEQSGGRHYRIRNVSDLPAISAKIGNELRNEYLLGYYPEQMQRDGRFHAVTLQLQGLESPLDLKTSYRRGYHAPAE